MLPFTLLFRDISKIEMPNEDKEFIKSRLKNCAFTSFWSHNYNSEINLIKNEQLASNNLSNNKKIITQKSDKKPESEDTLIFRDLSTPAMECFCH